MLDYTGIGYSLLAVILFMLIICIGVVPIVSGFKDKLYINKATLLEIFIISLVISIVYLCLSGIILSIMPVEIKRISSILFIITPIIWGASKLRLFKLVGFSDIARERSYIYISGTIIFTITLLIIANIVLPLPVKLPDGAYVNKEHVSAVRIQYLTGNLPADNALPYVVQEYLARNISFVENNPILPGQQVTNRPILISLVSLPIRLALIPTVKIEKLPTYDYVGTQWPDFRVLVRDEMPFAVFLGVATFLNACLILGIGLIALLLPDSYRRIDCLLILIISSSPYFIFQTIFTWPKALAGFFLLLGSYTIVKHKNYILTGALIGLAYLSHPYAIAYMITAVIMALFVPKLSAKMRFMSALKIVSAFSVVIMPWFVWAKIIIGLKSDLIAQNIKLSGMSIYEFVFVKIANLANTIFPTHLLSHGKGFTAMYRESTINLVGSVGVILITILLFSILFASVKKEAHANSLDYDVDVHKDLTYIAIYLGSSCILLTLVFGIPAVPLLHGWQPLVAFVILYLIYKANVAYQFINKVMLAQILINIMMFIKYLHKLMNP